MITEGRWCAVWRGNHLWSRMWGLLAARPRWQRLLITVISLWWLVWFLAQLGSGPHVRTPIGVVRALLTWADLPGVSGVDALSGWLRDPARRGALSAAAWAAGVLWAAAGQRSVLPCLLGWLVLFASAEALGYDSAARRALGGFAVLVVILLAASWPARRRMVVRRARLVPEDVLIAAGKAAAVCVLVAGYAPGRAVALVCAPYLTRPPRRSVTPVPGPPPDVPEPACSPETTVDRSRSNQQ